MRVKPEFNDPQRNGNTTSNIEQCIALGIAIGTGFGVALGLAIGNLALAGLNDTLIVEFEVDLAPVIADGTEATNQSELLTDDQVVAVSDDPNLDGAADPAVAGDEDPTRVPIASAPDFQVSD